MTLNEAIATIDRPQVDGLAMAYSQTGEEYIVLVSGGVKAECHILPLICLTEELAVKYWLDSFNEYQKDKPGIIYWRTCPEVGTWMVHDKSDTRREFGYQVYTIYSRFLISDKPVLRSDHERVKSYYEDMAKRAA